MKIKDRPEYGKKPTPLTCSPETSVLNAVKLMAEKNFGSIIVVDDETRVLGLMTERDIFKRVMAPELDPATTAVSAIMSNERFRRLPIVDADDRLVSVMSQGDFVSYTWPQLLTQVSTLARSTVSKNSQQSVILFGMLAYALICLVLVVVSLR